MNSQSKLRDLDFLKQDKNKLGNYQFFTVNEYIDDIKKKIQKQERVGKFYKNLYEKLLIISRDILEEPTEDVSVKNRVEKALSEIPLSEIQYHVDRREYETNVGRLGRNGILTLSDLYTFDFRNIKLRKNLTGSQWQDFLRNNYEIVISEWEDYNTLREYPREIDREKGVIDNLKKGLLEISEVLSNRIGSTRYNQTIRYESVVGTNQLELVAQILRLRFGECLSLQDIFPILYCSYENVRRAYKQTLTALLNGDIISENIRLNKALTEWIQSFRKEFLDDILFKPINELVSVIGDIDEEILSLFGLDSVTVAGAEGEKFIIPQDTKGIYRNVSEALISVLKDCVIPKSREEILEKTLSHKKLQDLNGGWNELFFDNILLCKNLVNHTGDGEYFINTKFLTTNEQKMARLIFEKGVPVKNEQIKREFETLYGFSCACTPQQLKKFGIIKNQYNLWSFEGEELDSTQLFIENFAEKNGIFFYTDLVQELIAAGYQIPNSIRTYITNLCFVDNADKNHFCLKKHVGNHSDFSWRSQSRAGLTNWVINRIKLFLTEQDPQTVTRRQLINHIEAEAKGTEFEKYIRQRVQSILTTFSGDGKPFLLVDEIVRMNPLTIDKIDYETIGLKGKNNTFYSQIRSIIQNTIKKTQSGRILFTDAFNLVNESLDETIGRNTIINALTNKFLPQLDLKLENEDGSLFIVKTSETIKIEPTYEITITSNGSDDIEEVKRIEPVTEREPVSYRTVLNWKELESILNHELAFYGRRMSFLGLDLGESIYKFMSFLKESDNRNLNQRLPQSLYEYWFASTDTFDRVTYVTNLTLYFEALLSEIYNKKYDKRLRTSGLGEWLKHFPYLQNALTTPWEELILFQKIFKQLYKNRNDIAHGEDIEMSSWEIAKAISDYTALYIFVIAKYT